MDNEKRFNLQTLGGEVVMRDITEENAYLTAYGTYVDLKRWPKHRELSVGEVTHKRYSLSGQKETEYVIVRTK